MKLQLAHRTSELCQIEQLMIDDLKSEINEVRVVEQQNIVECDKLIQNIDEKPMKQEYDDALKSKINNGDDVDGVGDIANKCKNESDNKDDAIKMEIKNEPLPCDNDKFEMLKNDNNTTTNINKQTTFHDNIKNQQQQQKVQLSDEIVQQQQQQSQEEKPPNIMKENEQQQKLQLQLNGDLMKNNRNSVTDKLKSEYEQFDIESEITPSFIMKKVENKKDITTTTPTIIATKNNAQTPMEKEKSFNDIYLTQQQQQQQSMLHVKRQQQSLAHFDKSPPLQQQQYNAAPQQQSHQYEQPQKLQQQQQNQEDDWLCIQKELNFINETKIHQQQQQQQQKPQTNNLYHNTDNTVSNNNHHDLFPNGCINNDNNNKHATEQQQHNGIDNIGEFFDSTDDDEVQRSVETRLEAMFGESPVPLSGKNDNDSQDIESGLEEIFGDAKSPIIAVTETGVNIIDAIKNKRLWEDEMATGNNFIQQQKNYYNNNSNNNSVQQQAHHIQLNCNNNPRWMQTMEAQFTNDFNGTGNTSTINISDKIADATRKRHWNNHAGDLLSGNDYVNSKNNDIDDGDDENDNNCGPPHSKKLCNGNNNTNFSVGSSSMSASSVSSSSSSSSLASATSLSPVSQQEQHQQHNVSSTLAHQNEILDAELLLHDINNGAGVTTVASEFTEMLQQPQQQAHFNEQQEFDGIMMNNVDVNTLQHQQEQHQHHHLQQQQQHYANIHQHQQHLLQQQQQQPQPQQQALINVVNNHTNNNNHVEFDDDISRHVQNAIDSILNLQNSESDSLPFSLDHSMGSLLGDSIILDDRPSTNNLATTTTGTAADAVISNMVSPSLNNQCQPTSTGITPELNGAIEAIGIDGVGIINNNNNKRRLNLVDDLGDCLISGASQCGDNASNILLYQQQQQYQHHNQQQQFHHHNAHQMAQGMLHNHHQQEQQQQQPISISTIPQQHHNTSTTSTTEVLNDFSCMVANIDEAVKSIMSS